MGCMLKGGGGLYRRLSVGAVLLAAGSASRMQHRPKCLLELGGVSLIRRQLIALSGAGVDELVVVLGHYAEHIEPAVREFPVTIVRNPDPDAGQASSVRCGLKALSPRLDCVVVALADQPLLNAADIGDVIKAYKQRPDSVLMVQPEHEGRIGNPIVFSADVRDQILSGGADVACRRWKAGHASQVLHWPTANARYFTDIDCEADIDALAQRTGHHLRWPATLVREFSASVQP